MACRPLFYILGDAGSSDLEREKLRRRPAAAKRRRSQSQRSISSANGNNRICYRAPRYTESDIWWITAGTYCSFGFVILPVILYYLTELSVDAPDNRAMPTTLSWSIREGLLRACNTVFWLLQMFCWAQVWIRKASTPIRLVLGFIMLSGWFGIITAPIGRSEANNLCHCFWTPLFIAAHALLADGALGWGWQQQTIFWGFMVACGGGYYALWVTCPAVFDIHVSKYQFHPGWLEAVPPESRPIAEFWAWVFCGAEFAIFISYHTMNLIQLSRPEEWVPDWLQNPLKKQRKKSS